MEDDITVKRRRHTPEQIVRKLREVERLLGEGQTIAEAAKQVEISEQTYHRWRNQYGGMKADDARRLRELERENARLERIVADKELEIDAVGRQNLMRPTDTHDANLLAPACCRLAGSASAAPACVPPESRAPMTDAAASRCSAGRTHQAPASAAVR